MGDECQITNQAIGCVNCHEGAEEHGYRISLKDGKQYCEVTMVILIRMEQFNLVYPDTIKTNQVSVSNAQQQNVKCVSLQLVKVVHYVNHTTTFKLELTPAKCINNCPGGFYGVKEYSKFGQVKTSRCQKCSDDCKNCIGPDSTQCISCQRNFYLKLGSNTTINPTIQGQCFIKQQSNIFFETSLFVQPQESTIPISQQNGSLNNPFDNIYNALIKAQEISALYQKSIINIFLQKGDHYLLRNMTARYTPRDAFDNDNLNIQIIIQPFYCQANESIDPTLCYDDQQSKCLSKRIINAFSRDKNAAVSILKTYQYVEMTSQQIQ
eukprot:403365410